MLEPHEFDQSKYEDEAWNDPGIIIGIVVAAAVIATLSFAIWFADNAPAWLSAVKVN